MRTLSARILLGFVALTITFGIFATNIVWNLREVEDEASLILRGYVPLALAAASLKLEQENLRNYLEQGISDADKASDVVNHVTALRKKRDKALEQFLTGGPALGALVTSDGAAAAEVARHLPLTTQDAATLKQLHDEVNPQYPVVLAAPPLHAPPAKPDGTPPAAYDAPDPQQQRAYDTLLQVRELESKIAKRVASIQNRAYTRAQTNKDWLANNERKI